MNVIGIEGLSGQDLQRELDRGGKFVLFGYCISVVILTFRRSSEIYFVKGGESAVGKSCLFSLVSLLFGWWGIPWGPIYTIGALITNFSGGKDVTREVVASLAQAAPKVRLAG